MYVGVIFNEQKKMEKGWNNEKLIAIVCYRVRVDGRKDRSTDPMHACTCTNPLVWRSKLDLSFTCNS